MSLEFEKILRVRNKEKDLGRLRRETIGDESKKPRRRRGNNSEIRLQRTMEEREKEGHEKKNTLCTGRGGRESGRMHP
jgi:hypothetical protein